MTPWPAWVPTWARGRIMVTREGCWRWTGTVTRKGYARTPRKAAAHRVMWEASGRELPAPGQVLDHVCHDPATCAGGDTCPHRRCVNPAHLRAVTSAQNTSRGRTVARPPLATPWAGGTCRRGHDVTAPGAVYVYPGGRRECRACRAWHRRARESR